MSEPPLPALDYVRLSKTLAHALRHAPWIYELELDAEGWTPVSALLDTLRERRSWAELTAAHLDYLVANQSKERYEMVGGRIRALYGHSLAAKIVREAAVPPAILYHGTAPATAEIIRREGLQPMRRQYVHLSADVETAAAVGKRKANQPLILEVAALKAHAAGVPFYRGNDLVWLADHVPAAFVR